MKLRTWRHLLICTKLHKWLCFRSVFFPLHYTNSKGKSRFLTQSQLSALNCVLQSSLPLPHWCFPTILLRDTSSIKMSAWHIRSSFHNYCETSQMWGWCPRNKYFVSLPQELCPEITILSLTSREKRNTFFWRRCNHTVFYRQICVYRIMYYECLTDLR